MAGERDPRYFPCISETKIMDLEELCEILSERATFNSGVIYGVAQLMANVIPEMLSKGRSVRLGNLGTFSLSMKGEGHDKPEDVKTESIKELKVNFRASPMMKKKLDITAVKFRKIK